MKISRRKTLSLIASAPLLALTDALINNNYATAAVVPGSQGDESRSQITGKHNALPVFCVAYIDPGIESQKGQEHIVAKYPVAIIPQDNRGRFIKWRDTIRKLNPGITYLAYQMVAEETRVPGPGHDIMRKIENSWVRYPGGITPTVTYNSAPSTDKFHRLFDTRKKEWQDKFIEACLSTLHSYDYQGLFLDQCTILGKASLNPYTRHEMKLALNETLERLRSYVGEKRILIGNSSMSWPALNGEMNESRPHALENEMNTMSTHHSPRMELFLYQLSNNDDDKAILKMLNTAISHNAYFGVSRNYQEVIWPDAFDAFSSMRQ